MLKGLLVVAAVLLHWPLAAQEFKIEYDKDLDLSQYRSFRFGEGQIITPQDLRQVEDAKLHQWVRGAIADELVKKGLKQVDSAADLVVSYIVGSQIRSDAGNVGPLGMTPGSDNTTYMRDYRRSSLVIDLNDTKGSKLVWRISTSVDTGMGDAQTAIDQTVSKGFKKFSIQPKKGKKKK